MKSWWACNIARFKIKKLTKNLVANITRKEARNHHLSIPALVEYKILQFAMTEPSWYSVIPEPRWEFNSCERFKSLKAFH